MSSTKGGNSTDRRPLSTKEGPGSPKIIKSQSKKEKGSESLKLNDSSVASAAAKGRQRLPGGNDGGRSAKKSTSTKTKQKRERKPIKSKPKIHPILLYLGYGGDIVLKDRRAIEVAQSLDLRQYHLRILKTKFDNVDVDGSGSLDAGELFESVGESRTPLTDKLFELLDLSPTGTLVFDDYVRIIGTYAMFTKEEILRFCFRCFDHDDSGTIDEKEFCELCKVVNNASPLFPGNFQRALDEFDVNEDGLIDYAEFLELDRRYPLVLFPAFKLQDGMQKHTLGESTWLKISEGYHYRKRIEEYKNAHGGKLPPESFFTRLGRMFFPCMYPSQKVHIKIGGDIT